MFLFSLNTILSKYCQNDYAIQGNLQVQCNHYEITNDIFHRNRTKKIYNLYGNTNKPEIVKAILRKKNRAGVIRLHDQTIQQSYSHQNSMILTKTEIQINRTG